MLNKLKKVASSLRYLQVLGYMTFVAPVLAQAEPSIQVDESKIGFKIPDLADILTFLIRGFFILAGVMALLMLLMGALAWVTSGGNKENVDKAVDKITAAVLGLIIIVAVLAIIVTMEQIVFGQRLCLGLSCGITIPSLLQEAGTP